MFIEGFVTVYLRLLDLSVCFAYDPPAVPAW
jgi:hypothetical protein